MVTLKAFVQRNARFIISTLLLLGVLFLSNGIAVLFSGQSIWFILVGLFLALFYVFLARELAAKFIQALYDLETRAMGRKFLNRQIFGVLISHAYLQVKHGKIDEKSDDIAVKVGGPALLRVSEDSAVVLENAGNLTRVVRGKTCQQLESFERVWDVILLSPHHQVFSVDALTRDGIPIVFDVDLWFRVGDTDEDVFKAATSKWVRENSYSESERFLIWNERVVVCCAEDSLRSILAQYSMAQLVVHHFREQVRKTLVFNLADTALDFGVEIVHITLENFAFDGELVDRWIEDWRAERKCAVQAKVMGDRSAYTGSLERARCKVCQGLLKKMSDNFHDGNREAGNLSPSAVVCCCFKVVKQTVSNSSLVLPFDIEQTLASVEEKLEEMFSI